MSAALDALDGQIAEARARLTAPGFRVRSDAEHRAATRRDLANVVLETLGGEPIPEPAPSPPSPESQAALAELLAELHRLEADAAELRNESLHNH
jgi:hypothetical protein